VQKVDGEVIVTFFLDDVRHIIKRNSRSQEVLLRSAIRSLSRTTAQEVRDLFPRTQKAIERVTTPVAASAAARIKSKLNHSLRRSARPSFRYTSAVPEVSQLKERAKLRLRFHCTLRCSLPDVAMVSGSFGFDFLCSDLRSAVTEFVTVVPSRDRM
jgi:hypothetical protein